MNYVVKELDRNYLGVMDRGSNFIAFTKIDTDIKDKTVLMFLTGTRNGDGILFLIDHLKAKSPDGKLYIRSRSVLVIPPVLVDKIKDGNILEILEDNH